ncbi:MAG: 5-formyltetrahydrofolate cyclo-ligase [Akkermansia sp.]|nr:5-formyltetrahydrofolate cyclo-ligase [Akkermansia sp.]MBR2313338.1 5-formyltetrahydrofolate cyclo-ligase [Akkermansia sp.]
MIEQKKQLRHQVLQRLKSAAAADTAQLRSFQLRARLAEHLHGETLNIAIYAPLPHEVDLMPLLSDFPQHRYAFPRCGRMGAMQFHHVQNPAEELEPGAMGILAPKAGLPVVGPEEIDLLIVPGVAFAASGQRLGYGGGYYDRYIPGCTRARVLALAFAEQMEPAIPTEPHDLTIPEIIHL